MTRITPAQAWDAIEVMLERLDDPATRAAYITFHRANRDLAMTMPAAVRAHHAFPGGYPIHIREVMSNLRESVANPAILMGLNLGFDRNDAITASYVHDLDKLLYRYELDPDKPSDAQVKFARDLRIVVHATDTKAIISAKIDAKLAGEELDESRLPRHRYRKDALEFEDGAIVAKLCWEHGLPLSYMALHAVCVHHGGWAPLTRTQPRTEVQPLGALLHAADYISSTAQRGEGNWVTAEPVAPQPTPAVEDPDAPPPPPPED